MAVITSAGSGNFGTGATWVGGVVPVLGDSVIIAVGHTVTVDGTYHVGDDTNTAFEVRGTLRASRTVNSSLTVRGLLFTQAATTATIDYGRKSTSDRIPTGITATLILNSSASMANFKYGLFVADTSNAYFGGELKNINARITSAIPVGGTTCTVDDATGWAVGDKIIMAPSNGSMTSFDDRTILTITPTVAPAATITFAATTFAHGTNCPIGNRTSNVTVRSFNTTNSAFCCFRHTSTSSNNRREVDNTVFEYVSSNSSQIASQIFVSCGTSATTTPFLSYDNNFHFATGQTTSLFMFGWNSGGFQLSNLGFFDNVYSGNHIYTASATFAGLKNSVFYYTIGTHIFSSFSQGGQGCLYTDNTHCAISGNLMVNHQNGDGSLFTRCGFHTSLSGNAYTRAEAGSGNFINCNFGKVTGTAPCPSLWGTPSFTNVNNTGTDAIKGEWVFTDCNFGTPSGPFNFFYSVVNPQYSLKVINKDMSVTAQEEYTLRAIYERDNSVFNRSTSSIVIRPQLANTPATRTFTVFAPNNTLRRVVGYLRYDATYGTGTPPSVTLSGLGITPQTYTAGGTANTWYKFDLSATQTSGVDGNLVLTVTGQSTATTGRYYIDGIISDPYVTATRHYGFLFDSSIFRTVNPFITQTNEATVGAYTGISISGSTITITQNRTIQELYDFCQWYACQTANLTSTVALNTSDGVNYSSTFNIVLNGGNLTGSGVITTTGTLTVTGSETSTVVISASNGTSGYLYITGLSGHAVYLQNNSGTQMAYQSSVTGTYGYFLKNNLSGTWTYVIKKPGFTYQRGTLAPSTGGITTVPVNTPQKFVADGSAMYTATSNALCTINISGTTQANIDIGNGSVLMQEAFDMTETALATNAGMIWLALRGECSIFRSASGNFLFLTDNWRIRRRSAGDANATLLSYVSSTQGIMKDPTNGDVTIFGAVSAEDIAAAVRVNLAVELSQIDELHKIQGLSAGAPMTVTNTTRVAGSINLAISGNGTTTTTVTRV
jgi:hypothetical protein